MHKATREELYLERVRPRKAFMRTGEKCKYCSFDPTSASDYCDEHRPVTSWDSLSDEKLLEKASLERPVELWHCFEELKKRYLLLKAQSQDYSEI